MPASRSSPVANSSWAMSYTSNLAVRKDCFGATPKPTRETRALPKTLPRIDHVLRVDAAFFHHLSAGRAQSKFVQSDHLPIEADVLVPNFRHSGSDCHT